MVRARRLRVSRASKCFSTLWSSTLSAASRTTDSGGAAPLPDLELGQPPPSLPVGEGEFTTDVDPSVAGIGDPVGMLSLPDWNLSVAQRQGGTEILGVISSSFAASAAPGTVLTRGAFLKSTVPEASTELGVSALPMTSGPSFFGFFANVLLVGPRRASPALSQPTIYWSYANLVKAAVTYWHSALGVQAVCAKERGPQMGAPWIGLRKLVCALREKASHIPARNEVGRERSGRSVNALQCRGSRGPR